MPDNDLEVEDDGLRCVTFADLLEPKMVKAAAVRDTDKSQHSQKEEALAKGIDETSLSVY